MPGPRSITRSSCRSPTTPALMTTGSSTGPKRQAFATTLAMTRWRRRDRSSAAAPTSAPHQSPRSDPSCRHSPGRSAAPRRVARPQGAHHFTGLESSGVEDIHHVSSELTKPASQSRRARPFVHRAIEVHGYPTARRYWLAPSRVERATPSTPFERAPAEGISASASSSSWDASRSDDLSSQSRRHSPGEGADEVMVLLVEVRTAHDQSMFFVDVKGRVTLVR